MTETTGADKLERNMTEPSLAEGEAAGVDSKVSVQQPPAYPSRDARPVTNLGKVFGQFAELQQQIAEQVVALEDSVHHQKQDLAMAVSELPELRERINWLVASFYEQSKKDEGVRERISRHDSEIENLNETVRAMRDQQARWEGALDEMIESLKRVRAAIGR
jgi:uncharacterized coiled-coil DUF342 family protein